MDLSALLGNVTPGPDAHLEAMRRLGLLGQVSGDKVLSGVGESLQQQAAQRERLGMDEARNQALSQHRMALERLAEARLAPQAAQADAALVRTGQAPRFAPEGAPPPTPKPAPAPKASQILAPPSGDAEAIADAIIAGKQPPDLKGLFRNAAPVRAALARKGFDQSAALNEWNATQKHLSTLNGPQQERLRQAISFAEHQLGNIEGLYQQWQQKAPTFGMKVLNKASLAAARSLGGEAGALAQALEGQINDLTGEIGNIYMGGNSPTDHALALAKENLQADWDEPTFKKALELLRTNIRLRHNAMLQAPVGGVPGSRYFKPSAPEPGTPAEPAAAAPAANDQDKAAKAWATANPNDPRAAKILEKLKAKGL